MYGKIFAEIFDSTLMAEGGRDAVYVFMSLIALADQDGIVAIDERILANKIGMELNALMNAIEVLQREDNLSNITANAGKRIIPVSELDHYDGNRGWWICNYDYYRQKGSAQDRAEKSAERSRRWREQKNANACERTRTHANANERKKRHTDTDTDTDTDTKIKTPREKSSISPCPYSEIINLYHTLLPQLPHVEKLTSTRQAHIRQRWREDLPELKNWEYFFDYVSKSDFLMGRAPGTNGRPPFIARLDWLVKPENFAKIDEGYYHRSVANV